MRQANLGNSSITCNKLLYCFQDMEVELVDNWRLYTCCELIQALTAKQRREKRGREKASTETWGNKRAVSGMQAKKIRRVQSAFEMFNRMMQTPGKSELTLTELRVSIPLAIPRWHVESNDLEAVVLHQWRSSLAQVSVDDVSLHCDMHTHKKALVSMFCL